MLALNIFYTGGINISRTNMPTFEIHFITACNITLSPDISRTINCRRAFMYDFYQCFTNIAFALLPQLVNQCSIRQAQ